MSLTLVKPDQSHTRFVTVKKAAEMTGISQEAIRKRVQRGIWLEGREYRRDPLGRIMLDTGKMRPFELAEEAEAPGTPTALYRHFDVDGVLLYIGVSLSPFGRLAAHDIDSHWSKQIAKVELQWLPSRPAALRAEAAAIARERPLHNIVGNAAVTVANIE